MKVMYGTEVFESLGEVVNPKHTAVVVVDMQNDFFMPMGRFELIGYQSYVVEAQKMIPKLAEFLDAARKEGLLIIFIQHTTLANGLSDSGQYIRGHLRIRGEVGSIPFTVDGTWGHEIVDELKPLPNEPVVKKYRASAFHPATNLDFLLRNNNIKSLIITGGVTRGCVEATAFGGYNHDYYVTILSDCVVPEDKTLQPTVLYDVVTSEDILREWATLRSNIGRDG